MSRRYLDIKNSFGNWRKSVNLGVFATLNLIFFWGSSPRPPAKCNPPFLYPGYVPVVSLPWITQKRWHTSSKKNRPSWCLFPFRMAPVLLLRTAWIADILSPASLRDVQRQRRPRLAGTLGQLYGTTERSFNAVDRRALTLTWTVCKTIGGSR